MQVILHYFLHFIFPGLIAYAFFRKDWRKAYLIFLLTMMVDLDHLWAEPIFKADRCSIGYHFLHSYIAIGIYIVFLFLKPLKLIGLGLTLHMVTDLIDCLFMIHKCANCSPDSWVKSIYLII
jgi:hypothetical protein